jgi:predicted GNAT superfamily acetyltransferase
MSETETSPATGLEPAGATIEIRHLRTWDEFHACVELQQDVWGVTFADLVPASILKVSQRVGGVTAGAFDGDGRLIGFVFGISGVEPGGRLVHWSDMMGIRTEARDRGLGRRLKYFQRDALRPLGVSVIYWTYDPLVARNAYFNLMQLGTDIVEYVKDFYGASTSSVLHQGVGTDRFVVAWRIDVDTEMRAAPTLPPVHATEIPILNDGLPGGDRPPRVRVAIPLHIDKVQQQSLADAAAWRVRTRPAFQWALANGYRIVAFQRDDAHDRGLYELNRQT